MTEKAGPDGAIELGAGRAGPADSDGAADHQRLSHTEMAGRMGITRTTVLAWQTRYTEASIERQAPQRADFASALELNKRIQAFAVGRNGQDTPSYGPLPSPMVLNKANRPTILKTGH